MNTNTKGNIALGRAIGFFTEKGYSVSLPLNDTQPYDLIIDCNGELLRVDVKYTSRRHASGSYFIDTTTRGYNGYCKNLSDDVDMLFVVTESDDAFCIPTNDIDTQTFTVTGRVEYKV